MTKVVKISAFVGLITGIISIWQFLPHSTKTYSGEWKMTLEVQQAEFSKFRGARIDWVLHLTQTGNSVSGTGEKIAVDSIKLDYANRTNLRLEGEINDNSFVFHYTEKGKLRETTGIFTGIFNGDKFSGDFSQTASDSRGKITGYKNN